MNATETGQRWCVRLLSIAYYFVIGPFLYDLFANGARWRSAYLFPYVLLSVIGLQAGFKQSDRWVRLWYWLNFVLVITVTCLAFFSPPFSELFAFYDWEKWIHLGILISMLLFFPLHFFLARKPMKPVSEEEDLEKGLPSASSPTKNPTV
ncbi:MAG: hypothetical protein WCK01_04815 [Candidatus Uhrbacteria bacterium]